MIIHRDYCSKCKTKEGPLLNYTKSTDRDGNTVMYKSCLPCNAERHKKWYERNPKKAQIYNRRYRTRNFLDL